MSKPKYQIKWRPMAQEDIARNFPKLPSPEERQVWLCKKDDYILLVVSTLESNYFWRGKHEFYGEGDSRITNSFFTTLEEAQKAAEEWANWYTVAMS